MADIRSLLRNELAARQGASPAGSAGSRATKKRKVDNGDDLIRKRMRPTGVKTEQPPSTLQKVQPPSAQVLEEETEEEVVKTEEDIAGPELPPEQDDEPESVQPVTETLERHAVTTTTPEETPQTVDEDEWAAFERDVVAPTRVPQAPAAVAAAATISAAPVSAEELAAQQQAKESMARAREAEVEGEREDAARFLEDEFDEMEQLEERVRRLKQMREELRNKRRADGTETAQDETPILSTADEASENQAEAEGESDEYEDDDDDDDDGWDEWRFR